MPRQCSATKETLATEGTQEIVQIITNQTKNLKDLIRFAGFLAEGDYLGMLSPNKVLLSMSYRNLVEGDRDRFLRKTSVVKATKCAPCAPF